MVNEKNLNYLMKIINSITTFKEELKEIMIFLNINNNVINTKT